MAVSDAAGPGWLRPPRGTESVPRGTVVRDLATGRVGVLQDVTLYTDIRQQQGATRPRLLAFIRPVGGGCEWTTAPDHVRPVGDTEG